MKWTEFKKFSERPLEEIQTIYNECSIKAVNQNKPGTFVLVNDYGFNFKDGTSIVRRILHDIGVELDDFDMYWIRRSKLYSESDRNSRIRESLILSQSTVSDSVKQARNEARSNTVSIWHGSLSEQEIQERIEADRRGIQLLLASLSPEERAKRFEEQGKKVTAYWKYIKEYEPALYARQTERRGEKVLAGQIAAGFKWCAHISVHKIGDKEVFFQSSWEYPFYLTLLGLRVAFQFANEAPGNVQDIDFKFWNPDFVLEEKCDILEVKGHPEARKKFYEQDLPAFLQSKFAQKYNLYLCEYNVERYSFSSYEELLKSLTLIHKVT